MLRRTDDLLLPARAQLNPQTRFRSGDYGTGAGFAGGWVVAAAAAGVVELRFLFLRVPVEIGNTRADKSRYQ